MCKLYSTTNSEIGTAHLKAVPVILRMMEEIHI